MPILMRIILIIILFLLKGCASTPPKPLGTIKILDAESIMYEGETSEENVSFFEKALTNSTIKTVIISSVGGDVDGGLKLGRLIKEFDLNVIVRGACTSSCANYIIGSG